MSRGLTGYVVMLGSGVALAAVVAWVLSWERTPEPAPPRPPFFRTVTLAAVERGTLAPEATLTGVVRSAQRARVGFDVSGRIAQVHAREGDVIEVGKPLATLDLGERATRLAVARAGTARAQRELDLVRAGSRAEEIRRLEAQVAAAQADLAWSSGETERMRPLVEGSVVTRSSYESMLAQRDAARGRLDAAQAALALAQAGPRAEEIAVAEARVAEAVAGEAQAQHDLDRASLLAPFRGQVVRRLLAPGDAVTPGMAVLELIDLASREIHLDIPARHAARLPERAEVHVTADEQPDLHLTTIVHAHVHAADERTGSTRGVVRLEPGSPGDELVAGAFVRARVALEPWVGVLLVPSDALLRTLEGWSLAKAVTPPASGGPSGLVAEVVPVRVLDQMGGRAAVEPLAAGALDVGMRVVVVGADLVRTGMPLVERASPPPAAPPAGAAR